MTLRSCIDSTHEIWRVTHFRLSASAPLISEKLGFEDETVFRLRDP